MTGTGDQQTTERDAVRETARDVVDVAAGLCRFTVPGEPRGKGRPRFFVRKGGAPDAKARVGTFTDNKTASYENLIKLEAQAAGIILTEGPVTVRVIAYLGVPKSASKKRRAAMLTDAERPTRKPDIDNVIKAVLDGLNGVAFADDKQVVGLTISKFWSTEPHLEITVRPA